MKLSKLRTIGMVSLYSFGVVASLFNAAIYCWYKVWLGVPLWTGAAIIWAGILIHGLKTKTL